MTERFQPHETQLQGLTVIERQPIFDERGSFERIYCMEELKTVCLDRTIHQINRSMTRKLGTVRGLHFQLPPHCETKIISCLRGRVYDVAVDLRCGSPTFLQYHAEELSDDNYKTMIIPEGFAHGFQTLTHDCELLYFHTRFYNHEAEAGFHPCDEKVDIEWPLPIQGLSERDKKLPRITDNFEGINL